MKAKGIQVNERACNLHMLAFSDATRWRNPALKRWNFEELESVSQLMEKEAVGINVHTYRLLLDCFTSSGKDEEAKGLLAGMHGKGLKVDAHSYSGEWSLQSRGHGESGGISGRDAEERDGR
ncbi:hypothetical protein SAY86_026361 [Trapa natans]|uniref:Pentatricopeptide repeat-containing protein n=1 Tax=Trapa natans TaxID=22666 RepID=A0AAN7QEF7_TRANT|nr:hypothetical protein SAY86_026361 [Trapa natans]